MKTDCRGTLLEVATRLFAERGLYGVSIRELSQAANVSISMVSYHFGGKEGLYAAVLTEQFACFENMDVFLRPGGDPLKMIEAYLAWTIQRHRNNPHLLRFYTSELTNPTPYFAAIVSPAIERIIRALADIVEQGVSQGRFRPGVHPVNAALALAGMINYFFLSILATESLISHSPADDEALVAQYLEIFTRGILAGAQ